MYCTSFAKVGFDQFAVVNFINNIRHSSIIDLNVFVNLSEIVFPKRKPSSIVAKSYFDLKLNYSTGFGKISIIFASIPFQLEKIIF